jgi:tetratricopeptide (TPR) repeat protein
MKKMSEYLDKAVASGIRDPELAAFVGYVYLNQGRFDKAESVLATAVRPLQDRGRWLEWVNANGGLAIAAAAQKRCSEAMKLAELGLERSKNLQGQAQASLVITANTYLAFTRYLCGDFDAALELGHANRLEAASTNNLLLEALAVTFTMHAAAHHPTLGSTNEAQKIVHDHQKTQGLAVLKEWRQPIHARMRHVVDNDLPEACRMAEEAVTMSRERNNLFGEALAHRVWAQALDAHNSSDPEIDAHMARSRDLFRQGNCLVEVDRTHAIWDELRVKRGDPPAR